MRFLPKFDKDSKDDYVTVRVTKNEHDALRFASAQEGVSVSNYIRSLIFSVGPFGDVSVKNV